MKKIIQQDYKIGVEMECFTTQYDRDVDYISSEIGLLPFTVGEDGSIEDYDGESMEIRSNGGLSYSKTVKGITKLSEILLENHVAVNESCGLHVHMSNELFFNEAYMKKIVYLWVAIEDMLLATQPQSRFNNTYCRRYLLQFLHDVKSERVLPKGKEALIDELQKNDRYYTLNLAALEAHGTIEVRMHAGTINSTKIIAWIDLLQNIYNYALSSTYSHKAVTKLFTMPISEEKIQEVFALLQVSEGTREHFMGRINKFLFATLQKHQETANKLMGMQQAVKKATKAYYKSRDALEELETVYKDQTNDLRSSRIVREDDAIPF